MRVYDLVTGEQGETIVGYYLGKLINSRSEKFERITCMAVFGGRILSGGLDSTVRLWDVATGQQVGEPMRGHSGRVTIVAFFENKIISAGEDCTIRVWDIALRHCVCAVLDMPATSIACSSPG